MTPVPVEDEQIGPTPADLGQGDGRDLSKWDALRTAGRPRLTGVETYG